MESITTTITHTNTHTHNVNSLTLYIAGYRTDWCIVIDDTKNYVCITILLLLYKVPFTGLLILIFREFRTLLAHSSKVSLRLLRCHVVWFR